MHYTKLTIIFIYVPNNTHHFPDCIISQSVPSCFPVIRISTTSSFLLTLSSSAMPHCRISWLTSVPIWKPFLLSFPYPSVIQVHDSLFQFNHLNGILWLPLLTNSPVSVKKGANLHKLPYCPHYSFRSSLITHSLQSPPNDTYSFFCPIILSRPPLSLRIFVLS